ncbi:unnamed protein product [Chrysoparadoxa australica]
MARLQTQLQLLFLLLAQVALFGAAAPEDGSEKEKSKGSATYWVSDWHTLALITTGLVLLFQDLFHRLDVAIKPYRWAHEMVEALYRELTVLGLVAFFLFALEVWSITPLSKKLFEPIKMALFITALLYICFCACIVLLSKQISRKWDWNEDLSESRYADMVIAHKEMSSHLGLDTGSYPSFARRTWLALTQPKTFRRYLEVAQTVKFHELKYGFIASNHLPREFRFTTYLKKCMQHITLHLVEITNEAWVGVAWVVALHLYFSGLTTWLDERVGLTVLHTFSGAICLMATVMVYFKVHRVAWDIVHSDMLKHDAYSDRSVASQKSLFWFGRPGFVVAILQMIQFLLAINVAILTQFGGYITQTELIASTCTIALSGAFYVFTLPQILPTFTMITNVGELVDRRRLSEALVKQQRSFRRSTLPPSLRQATLLARLMTENMTLRKRIQNKLDQPSFQTAMCWLISIDFFVIAVNGREFDTNYGQASFIVEAILLGMFLLEALAQIYCRGIKSIVTFKSPMVSLDILLVIANATMVIMVPILASQGKDYVSQAVHASEIIVVLRLLRYSRILRMVWHQDKSQPTHAITAQKRATYLNETKTLLEKQHQPKVLEEGLAMVSVKDIPAVALPLNDVESGMNSPAKSTTSESLLRKDTIAHSRSATKEFEVKLPGADLQHSTVHGAGIINRVTLTASALENMNEEWSIKEAWERACLEHPEITAVHGKLSVPMLCIMLGMKAFEGDAQGPRKPKRTFSFTDQRAPLASDVETRDHRNVSTARDLRNVSTSRDHRNVSTSRDHRTPTQLALAPEDLEAPMLPIAEDEDVSRSGRSLSLV